MKKAKRGATVFGLMVGIALACAPPGHADKAQAFGDANYQVICDYVAQEPTAHGIWAAISVLLTQQIPTYSAGGLDHRQMQSAVGYAIKGHCPKFSAAYSDYRSRYR